MQRVATGQGGDAKYEDEQACGGEASRGSGWIQQAPAAPDFVALKGRRSRSGRQGHAGDGLGHVFPGSDFSQGVVVGYELESEAYCVRSPPQGDEGQAPGKGLDDEEQQGVAASPVSLLVGQHDPTPWLWRRPHEALGDDHSRKEQPGREREAVG